jgi:hypothetical protein
MVTPISKTVTDICAIVTMFATMWKSSPLPSKGILVENKDSYVDILAHSWAGLAAKNGPLILESMPSSVADDMRCRLPRIRAEFALKDCIGSEMPNAPESPDFSEYNAVLLHGKLIRTFCDELSLQAMKTAVTRSGGNIKLVTGDSRPYGINPTDPAGEQLRHMLVDFEYDRAQTKGVHIQATAPDSVIRLSTNVDSSKILLAHGATAGQYEAPATRKLLIDNQGVILSEKDGSSLTLKKKGVKLLAKEEVGLAMSESGIMLKLNNDIALTLDSNVAALSHPNGIEIKMAGNTYLKLTHQGLEASGGLLQKLKGQLIQAG